MSYSNQSSPSSASSSGSSTPSSRSHPHVHHWTAFVSSFTALTTRLRSDFTSLPSLPLPSQRRLVDSLESDVFRGKTDIESIESYIRHFPYHLRSKASVTIDGCKSELEGWYGLLLLYQQAHRENRTVRPSDLDRHHRDHPPSPLSPSLLPSESKERSLDPEVVLPVLDDDAVTDRTSLLSSPSSSRAAVHPLNAHRTALLATSGHLSDFASSAGRTEGLVQGAAYAGEGTARALAEQRESLMKQRHLLHSSVVEAGEGGRAMDRMQWRLLSDKLIAWLVVALQIFLFCLIGYVKYFRLQ